MGNRNWREETRSESVSRVIDAPPDAIFSLLRDPARHHEFDGSGMVRGADAPDPQPLNGEGDTFGMRMRQGLPYRAISRVVAFEQDRTLAWQPFLAIAGVTVLGGQVWRYDLRPTDAGTLVTETYVWGASKTPLFLKVAGYPKRMRAAMELSLERLANLVEA